MAAAGGSNGEGSSFAVLQVKSLVRIKSWVDSIDEMFFLLLYKINFAF